MASFASLAEYENHVQRDIPDADEPSVLQALEMATGIIQWYTGQELFAGTKTEKVPTPANFTVFGGRIVLRQRPVTEVTALSVAGTSVDVANIVLDGDAGIIHVRLTDPIARTTTAIPEFTEITYSYGYAEIPDAIKTVTMELARQPIENPEGYSQITAGPFSASFGRGEDVSRGMMLSASHKSMLSGLR